MIDEMTALHGKQLVSLPSGKLVVGCRWVFTVKYHPNGYFERYKARLVAK